MILCCSCLLISGKDLISSTTRPAGRPSSSSPISFLVLTAFAFSSCLRLTHILSFYRDPRQPFFSFKF
jgi:hypothetical protein